MIESGMLFLFQQNPEAPLGREPYANTEAPNSAQTSPQEPKARSLQASIRQSFPLILDQLASSSGSPEKAGVGGSIPSLATI
jgi:hypothetical protein